MVQTIELTKQEWLNKYSRRALIDIFGPVIVGTEQRFYALTSEGQSKTSDGYAVVYVVN